MELYIPSFINLTIKINIIIKNVTIILSHLPTIISLGLN